jgi:squalene-hopene/tetraprenyl-beta-curcumene cyclase
MAVGERADAPYVMRAVRWVSSHQNDDGGFGETTDSYGNLGLAGVGESNAYTTGLVVSALIAAGGEARVIDGAVAYLLRIQRPDGLWPAGNYELVVNTPLPFYRIPADVWTAPLQALADYRMTGGGVHGVQPQVPSAGSPNA